MYFTKKRWAIAKTIVFLLCLTPFLLLINNAAQDTLGANPIQALHFTLGDWALRFLCLGLSITPLRKLFKQNWLSRFRRMIGLYTFFYASMHLLVFVVLDLSLSWQAFIDEVPKSPYILIGLLTFILLLPLAFTSTQRMQKRLGKKWLLLHKLVYVAGVTAVIHYLWLVKTVTGDPLFYAGWMFVLLGFRLFTVWRAKYHLRGQLQQ